jgi:hypothetical protein
MYNGTGFMQKINLSGKKKFGIHAGVILKLVLEVADIPNWLSWLRIT